MLGLAKTQVLYNGISENQKTLESDFRSYLNECISSENKSLSAAQKQWVVACLHECAKEGNVSIGQALLSSRYKIFTTTNVMSGGTSPVHVSCANNQVDFLSLLLGRGHDVNMIDQNGFTPLHICCLGDQVDCAQELIKHGAKLNVAVGKGGKEDEDQRNKKLNDMEGMHPVHVAAKSDALGVLDMLLDKLKAGHGAMDSMGRTPLHYAAIANASDCATLLLDRGTDVNAKDINGCTALSYCARHGSDTVMKILLDNGANRSLPDNQGWYPLFHVGVSGSLPCLEMLKEDIVDYGPAAVAVKYNNRAIVDGVVDALKAKYSPVRVHGSHWIIPLFESLRKGEEEAAVTAISKLLDSQVYLADALVFRQENEGWKTLLHVAAEVGSVRACQWLLKAKGRESLHCAVDMDLRTVVHAACIGGHMDVCRVLVEKGLPWTMRDIDIRTPLHYLCRHQSISNMSLIRKIVGMVLCEGNGIDCKDVDGVTPLHEAALVGQVDAVSVLMDGGANITISDNRGENSLHKAASGGHQDVVESLIASFRKDFLASKSVEEFLNCTTHDGRSALHIACFKNNLSIVASLINAGANITLKDYKRRNCFHYLSSCDVYSADHVDYIESPMKRANGSNRLFETVRLICDAEEKNPAQDQRLYHQTSSSGKTPLHEAVEKKAALPISAMLLMGAHVDCPSTDQRTPLHVACELGHAAVAKLLIDNGADINKQDCRGYSALHFSCRRGHIECVQMLLANGALKDLKENFGGVTPKDLAQLKKHSGILSLLAKDNKGKEGLVGPPVIPSEPSKSIGTSNDDDAHSISNVKIIIGKDSLVGRDTPGSKTVTPSPSENGISTNTPTPRSEMSSPLSHESHESEKKSDEDGTECKEVAVVRKLIEENPAPCEVENTVDAESPTTDNSLTLKSTIVMIQEDADLAEDSCSFVENDDYAGQEESCDQVVKMSPKHSLNEIQARGESVRKRPSTAGPIRPPRLGKLLRPPPPLPDIVPSHRNSEDVATITKLTALLQAQTERSEQLSALLEKERADSRRERAKFLELLSRLAPDAGGFNIE